VGLIVDFCGFLHHSHELLKVDLTISILINFSHSLANSILTNKISYFISLKESDNLFVIDLATAVLIKQFEGGTEVILTHEHSLVNGGSQELSVVDLTRTIRVCWLQQLKNVFSICFPCKTFFKFFQWEGSISIHIQLLE